MTNTLTLDSIRETAKRKYAPVTIGLSDGQEVVLRGLIRLNKADREAVLEHADSLELIEEGEGVDDLSVDDRAFVVNALNTILLKLSDKGGSRLVSEIAGDLTVLLEVFGEWATKSQLGEAESSPTS